MSKYFYIHLVAILLFGMATLFSSRSYGQTYATSQTNGVTGICLLCSVSNPNNPIDATSLTDYSTFNITAGLLGVTVYQTLIFPVSSTSCDSLVIGIGSGNSVLSVNIFGAVTVQTYNGSSANNDAVTIDSNNLRLIQNNTMGQVVLHPTATFDRVKLTLSSSLLGLLSGFRIYYAYMNAGVPSAPSFTVPSGTDCGSTQFPILNYTAGINYRVYEAYYDYFGFKNFDTAYTITNNSPIYAPNKLDTAPSSRFIYVQAVNPFTGCTSDTVEKEFTEGGYGFYPSVDADSLFTCVGDSVTLHAFLPGLITPIITWYDSAMGGDLLHTGAYYTVSPDTNKIYYAQVDLGGCNYPVRHPVSVFVSRLPAPVYTVPSGFYCYNDTIVVSNWQTGENYLVKAVYIDLYNNLILDTVFTVHNSNTFYLPNQFAFVPDNVVVTVQAIDTTSGCRSDTVKAEFTFGAFGQNPIVTPDSITICQGASAILHATEPNGSLAPLMQWYSEPVGGTLLYTGNYDTVSPPATTTYYVTAKLTCESLLRTPAKVIVNECLAAPAIKGYDQDGKIGSSDSLVIQAYPNPTSGWIHLNSKYNLKGSKLVVMDTKGAILQERILDDNSITLSGENGLYVIKVITADGHLLNCKILLQK